MIESMDGNTTREMSIAEVEAPLEGQPGSMITLAVVRERAASHGPSSCGAKWFPFRT